MLCTALIMLSIMRGFILLAISAASPKAATAANKQHRQSLSAKRWQAH
jgi:hypothetical protein